MSSSEFEFNVAEPVPVATGTGFSSDRNFGTRTRTRDQNPCETRGYSRTRAIHYSPYPYLVRALAYSPSAPSCVPCTGHLTALRGRTR